MNKLSHSSVSKFQNCPTEWRLHYLERLRSTTMSAALLFGTAIDKSVEKLVLTGDMESALEIFHGLWEKQEINGVLTSLQNNSNIVYAAGDMDFDLLPDGYNVPSYILILDIIQERKKILGFDNLKEGDKIAYNEANWRIAKVRGKLMLEAVKNEILPKITKVYSTQEKIDLENGTGDSVVGFCDLVADYEGYRDPIVFDFKTSTRAYEADSVKTSPQLALYVHALENKYKTRYAGFIVLSKQIQKNRKKICSVCGNDGTGARHKTCNKETVDGERCNGAWTETINPKAKIDVIIDEIPVQLENIVLENFDNISKLVTNGVFVRNLGACQKNWGPCIYINKCWKNSDAGLVKMEEKIEKK